jgi:hypothetical protein
LLEAMRQEALAQGVPSLTPISVICLASLRRWIKSSR